MITVLYVDDEPALLEICTLFLERTGEFAVDTVLSGAEALVQLGKKGYDAIISDYQMPSMDGISLLKQVRTGHGDIPFILFTGKGREDVVIDAINNGADFYLQKGGDPTAQFAELAHKVRQAVSRWRAELSRIESEKRLADIINFLPDATFAIDRTGHVIAWNRAIEEMTGVSAAEMIGKGDFEYAIPFYGSRRRILIDLIFEPDEAIAKNYAHIIHEKDILIADTTFARPKGNVVTLMGKASPLYDRKGEVIGAIESIRDITERTKAEEALRESEKRYRLLVQYASDGIFLLDKTGRIIDVNMAACNSLGRTREELTTMALSDIDIEWPSEKISALFKGLAPGEPATIEGIHTRKNATTFPVEMRVTVIDMVDRQIVLILARDITMRRRIEESLREREVVQTSTIQAIPSTGDKIRVSGIDIEWQPKKGTCTFEALPVAMMWINTTLAGVMAGVQSMVGTERFGLALQSEGRKSTEDDWQVISQLPDFRTGFKAIANIAAVAGWGDWELIALDEAKKECRFHVQNSWEGLYQKGLGECWGSGMLAGKLAGYCSMLFKTNCWADQTKFIANGDEYDEFIVHPSERTIELELDNLLATNEATRADMAVALQKLRTEITDRKQVEEAFRESERRNIALLDAIPDLIFVLTKEGIFIDYNAGDSKDLLLPPESFLHRHITDVLPPDLARETAERLTCLFQTGEPQHYEYALEVSGELQFYESRLVLCGEDQALSMIRNITGRKRMVTTLQESEEQYRIVTEQARDGIAIVQKGRLEYVNPALAAMAGYRIDELTGSSVIRFVAPESVLDLMGVVTKALSGQPVPSLYQTRIRHRDGHPIEIEASGTTITWKGSKALLGIIRDITESERIRNAALASEERFRTLADMLPQIIFEMDTAGRIRYANRQAFENLQVTAGQFDHGVDAVSFIAEKDRVRAAADIGVALTGRAGKGAEYLIRRQDGSTFPGLIFSEPIREGGIITGLRGVIVDISERKRMEEALLEYSEKLRILTSITRHDVQNKLMILRAYLIQAQQVSDRREMKEFIGKIDTLTQSIDSIVAFTKVYEEIGVKEPVWLDLRRVVSDEAAAAGAGTVELVLPEEGYEILVDRLFGRVFYNLIENTLRHGRNVTRITVSVVRAGQDITILYTDDGIGIPADQKERIFEKGVGSGTGLGLFLIRQILAITGITIRETGEPGKGARFEMLVLKGAFRRR